jgi:hypothetical protein
VAQLAIAALGLGQASFPEIWLSRTSAIRYRVTVKGQSFRAEKIFPAEFATQVADGAFTRCDYVPEAEAWLGKCESHLPLRTENGRVKWCKFKFASKVTTFTPARIEGETDVWENSDVDVDKCQLRKSHMQHFLWEPKT